MNAQQKALSNYTHAFNGLYPYCYARISGPINPDRMSFKNPKKNIGYGQLLVAIATLPKAQRKSMRLINASLNKPQSSSWGIHNFQRLIRAKLISHKNGIYSITKLGSRYISEMNLM